MFNHNTLEKDIERLSREVSERRGQPEYKNIPEREIVKQSIQPVLRQAILQSQAADKTDEDDKNSVLPKYLKESPDDIKLAVEQLIDKVFHKGLVKTIKEARRNRAFVLDAFHDALTDKLYEELKSRKML